MSLNLNPLRRKSHPDEDGFIQRDTSFSLYQLESVAVKSNMGGWCFPIKWPFHGHIVKIPMRGIFLTSETSFFKESEGCNVVSAGTNNHSKCNWWLSLGSSSTLLVSVGFPWLKAGTGSGADLTSLNFWTERACHRPGSFFFGCISWINTADTSWQKHSVSASNSTYIQDLFQLRTINYRRDGLFSSGSGL